VVIADDSLVAREMISQILSSDPAIEVVGQAKDGVEAVELVTAGLRPDLVTMDIHMPKLDGLGAIEQIMAYTPTPILVVSSSVREGGVGGAFDALALGALEVIKKPEPADWADLERIGRDVIRKVKVLASVRVITHIRGRRERARGRCRPLDRDRAHRSIVAIGSSTGGPSALLAVLGRLPVDLKVPVLIAQHIADGFVPGLVSWLNAGCAINVATRRGGPSPPGGNRVLRLDRVQHGHRLRRPEVRRAESRSALHPQRDTSSSLSPPHTASGRSACCSRGWARMVRRVC